MVDGKAGTLQKGLSVLFHSSHLVNSNNALLADWYIGETLDSGRVPVFTYYVMLSTDPQNGEGTGMIRFAKSSFHSALKVNPKHRS